jgi:glycosyltransferase involved in cell wall biosynthesis
VNKRPILIVSWGVPPAITGAATVVRGLAEPFALDELILVGEHPAGAALSSPLPHRTYYLTREWQWPKRGRRWVHWIRWLWLPVIVWQLIRIIGRERCAVVFAVFPNEYYMAAAYLAARLTGRPLIPHFHNTYMENRRGLALRFARWLQPRVFRASKVVFVMSDGMKEEWERDYPDVKFEPLLHTFTGEIPPFEPQPKIDPNHIRLACLGAVNVSNQEALRRISELVNATPNLSLNIYTYAAEWFLRNVGIAGQRIRYENPTNDELMGKLRSNDILVLPHGLTGGMPDIEYRTIFPTRTIPYLLSGRPILAHAPANSFLARWLLRHDCAILVTEPSPDQLLAAIKKLCDDSTRRETLVKNALRAAEQFKAETVANHLKRTIDSL